MSDAETHNRRAQELYTDGDLDGAAVELREAIRLDPDRYVVWGRLGTILKEQERYEEAIEAFRKVIDLEPDQEEGTLPHIAHCEEALGERRRPERKQKRATRETADQNDPAMPERLDDVEGTEPAREVFGVVPGLLGVTMLGGVAALPKTAPRPEGQNSLLAILAGLAACGVLLLGWELRRRIGRTAVVPSGATLGVYRRNRLDLLVQRGQIVEHVHSAGSARNPSGLRPEPRRGWSRPGPATSFAGRGSGPRLVRWRLLGYGKGVNTPTRRRTPWTS